MFMNVQQDHCHQQHGSYRTKRSNWFPNEIDGWVLTFGGHSIIADVYGM